MTADLARPASALRSSSPLPGRPSFRTGRAASSSTRSSATAIEGHRQKDEGEGQTFTKMIGPAGAPELPLDLRRPDTGGLRKDRPQRHLPRRRRRGRRSSRRRSSSKGILKGFLLSRTPVAGFSTSNGHGRAQAGQRPVGRQANLFVEAAEAVSEARLREMLVEECRKQGKPFGLPFRRHLGRLHRSRARFMPQSFKVIAHPGLPRLRRRAPRRARARRRPHRNAARRVQQNPRGRERSRRLQRHVRCRVGLGAGLGELPEPPDRADRGPEEGEVVGPSAAPPSVRAAR